MTTSLSVITSSEIGEAFGWGVLTAGIPLGIVFACGVLWSLKSIIK